MHFIETNTPRWGLYFFRTAWMAALTLMLTSQVDAQQAGQQFTIRVPINQVIRISKSISVTERNHQSQLDNLSQTPTLIKVERTTIPGRVQSVQGRKQSSNHPAIYQVLDAKSNIVEWNVLNNETPLHSRFQTQRVVTTIVPLL